MYRRLEKLGFQEKVEKEKVQAVVNWPVPRSIKNIQKFLQLGNYRQFVKDFTRVTKLFMK